MLVQSQTGVIEFLRALPKALSAGAVKGLRARGGHEVVLESRDGKLTRATIHHVPGPDGGCAVSSRGPTTRISVPSGESQEFEGQQHLGH